MNSPSADFPQPGEKRPYQGALGEESTQWNLIYQVRAGGPDAAREALLALLNRYAPVLRRYLQGPPWRFDPHATDDLVHGFLQLKFLQGQLLQHADARRGHFRSLLKVALDNFVRDQLKSRTESPLPQGRGMANEEARATDAPARSDPDCFEAEWARRLLGEAIDRMRSRCAATGQQGVWDVFEGRLLRPLNGAGPQSYERLAAQCGLTGPKEAANLLVTAKRLFRRVFEELVGEYSDADVNDELRTLRDVFATGISLAPEPSGLSLNWPDSKWNGDREGAGESWLVVHLLEDAAQATDHDRRRALVHLLDRPLSALLDDGHPEASLAGQTLRSLLASTAPSLPLLRAVKDWAKQQVSTEELKVPREILSLVYFTSIASARVHCHERLTGLADDALRQAMTEGLHSPWCDPALRRVLQQSVRTL